MCILINKTKKKSYIEKENEILIEEPIFESVNAKKKNFPCSYSDKLFTRKATLKMQKCKKKGHSSNLNCLIGLISSFT